MTEEEAFSLLRSYLVKLDDDAAKIDTAWPTLTDIIKTHQNAPPPVGRFADIQLISDRDADQAQFEEYEDADVDGQNVVIVKRSRAVEWLFRIRLFAGDQTANLKLFRTALTSQFSDVELYPLTVTEVGEIKTAPKLTADQWEGQSYLDVTLAALNTEKMIVDVIEGGRVTIVEQTSGIETEVHYQRD